jgi:16S rRNA (adenine1518-N6/adenine1519-N6)-dimethyltransferase
VESAIVRIDPDAVRRAAIRNREFLHDMLRRVFQQRRKRLRGVLAAWLSDRLPRPEIEAVLAALELDEHARAEQLSPEKLVALANALEARLGGFADGTDHPALQARRSSIS